MEKWVYGQKQFSGQYYLINLLIISIILKQWNREKYSSRKTAITIHKRSINQVIQAKTNKSNANIVKKKCVPTMSTGILVWFIAKKLIRNKRKLVIKQGPKHGTSAINVMQQCYNNIRQDISEPVMAYLNVKNQPLDCDMLFLEVLKQEHNKYIEKK